eukprot:2730289-Pyramimonas_sp.AAC.1
MNAPLCARARACAGLCALGFAARIVTRMPAHANAHARTCGTCANVADRSMAHTRTCAESRARICSHMPVHMHAHARTCGSCAELAD